MSGDERKRAGVLTRRGFLLGGAGVAAGATGVAAPSLAAAPSDAVARFVRAHCPADGLSDAEVADFADAFLSRSALAGARRRTVLFLLDNRWAHALLPPPLREAQARQERHLITRFVLSTDRLDAAREPGAPRYWGYADPYGLGCANPAARFDDP